MGLINIEGLEIDEECEYNTNYAVDHKNCKVREINGELLYDLEFAKCTNKAKHALVAFTKGIDFSTTLKRKTHLLDNVLCYYCPQHVNAVFEFLKKYFKQYERGNYFKKYR